MRFSLLRAVGSVVLRTLDQVTMVPKVVFVLGAPGAGKGTQCQRIVDEYGYRHLSAGDLLREERQNPQSEFGELIERHLVEGKIVPVDITCSLLERAMTESTAKGRDKFLIDGFPRNKDNVDGWTRRVAEKVQLQFVLVFDCTEPVCIERCLGRGAAGSGRTDDNLESLKKRFHTFRTESTPVIEHYRGQNLVRQIDGEKSPDDVFADVRGVFAELKASGDN